MVEILFWRASGAKSPIEKYLIKLKPPEIRDRVFKELEHLAEEGLTLLRTHKLSALRDHPDLYELRASRGRIEERILLVIRGDQYVAVHAFRKKNQAIRSQHIKLAIERIRDLERRKPV